MFSSEYRSLGNIGSGDRAQFDEVDALSLWVSGDYSVCDCRYPVPYRGGEYEYYRDGKAKYEVFDCRRDCCARRSCHHRGDRRTSPGNGMGRVISGNNEQGTAFLFRLSREGGNPVTTKLQNFQKTNRIS